MHETWERTEWNKNPRELEDIYSLSFIMHFMLPRFVFCRAFSGNTRLIYLWLEVLWLYCFRYADIFLLYKFSVTILKWLPGILDTKHICNQLSDFLEYSNTHNGILILKNIYEIDIFREFDVVEYI